MRGKDEAAWPQAPEDVKEKFCNSQGWGQMTITEQAHSDPNITHYLNEMQCW